MAAPELERAVAYVTQLHGVVDTLVAPLAARHAGRLVCRRGCAACCVDDLTVFDVEAERIRRTFPAVLHAAPGAPGACAFLDEAGACRVYEARPYVCRTQGLPLRWAEAAAERRDICPLNEPPGDLLSLPAEALWTIGPVEARLAAAQASVDGGAAHRVSLRSLFTPADTPPAGDPGAPETPLARR